MRQTLVNTMTINFANEIGVVVGELVIAINMIQKKKKKHFRCCVPFSNDQSPNCAISFYRSSIWKNDVWNEGHVIFSFFFFFAKIENEINLVFNSKKMRDHFSVIRSEVK